MAMAGVCAKVLQPVGGLRTQQQRSGGAAAAAVGRKKRTATRSSSSAVVSDGAAFSRARTISSYGTAAAAGRRCYYGSSGPLLCQAASSGGSRRDHQKIVARTQHRRARHVKGVTPSKPELLSALEDEENADAILGNDEEEEEEEEEEENPLPEDEAAAIPVETAKASYVGDKWVSPQGGEEEEGGGGGRSSNKGEKELNDQVQQSAEDVAEVSNEAVDKSARSLRRTGRKVGRNLEESREEGETILREGADAINKQTGRVGSDIQKGAQEVGETAQKLAALAQDTADESGKELQDVGQDVRQNIQEVEQEGEKLIRKGGEAVSEQAREAVDEIGKQAQRAVPEDVGRSVQRVGNRVERAAERVEGPIERAMDASREAVEAVGKEAFGVGQSLLEVAEQATGMAGAPPSNSRPKESDEENVAQVQQQQKGAKELGSGRKYKPAGKEVMRKFQGTGQGEKDLSDEGSQEEENADSYTGLRVLVAGASGRTGRLIVENLVNKGVPVRALVRDVNKARKIKELDNAELVAGDVYKYETVKQALGDSNVVICAIGLQGFTLDLLQTYKTEYEGVVNLISAAKNNGDVKKFVFITTIGLGSFLQIIPLLFWKRQAELFLQRSGLDYTIVRPGGLRNNSGVNESVELRPVDTQYRGGISRSKVAEVCVSALVIPESSEKIVEIVAGSGRTRQSIEDQFAAI
ncbi:unnamed protein product [Sphagnum troendelagicum]|uniref:NAD(P)-binding domain-containing protein n=1 Tax=Sphagnum troendelagicum TaxID=128251 RepID=A0ABP0TA76_9BRYO